jgi:hypothetical protein
MAGRLCRLQPRASPDTLTRACIVDIIAHKEAAESGAPCAGGGRKLAGACLHVKCCARPMLHLPRQQQVVLPAEQSLSFSWITCKACNDIGSRVLPDKSMFDHVH